ncbi:uncharacterized protein LOC144561977 isoform X2 [Carex rostrata]
MNPEFSLEVPDTPDRIRSPVDLQTGQLNQNGRSRNLRLGLSGRVEQPIILSSPATPKDEQRKRKSPSSVILISESSISESRYNKKGKSVVQEVEDESRRGPTFRDNKGKGKLDAGAYVDIQDIRPDHSGLNSPPRRVGQRFLVRSSAIAPSNTARGNVAFNGGGTGGALNTPKLGEERNRGLSIRDNEGKGKFDVDASNDAICVISPDQSGLSLPPQPVRRRYLVRNGVIDPRNIAERSATSKEDANAPKRSEVEADRREIVPQPSAVMLCRSGAQGPQHAGSSSGGGAGEDKLLSEIVADDLFERVIRSTSGATSNTSSWRSTHSNRPGRFNQTSTGSSRPNTAVSTASTHVTPLPTSGALSSTNSTGEIGGHPRQRGRAGSSSLHRGESSSMTNLSAAARARGRGFQAQRAVVRPVIDVDEIQSPDSGAAVRARQLAHDEMIARQLQEEFNNEIPVDWGMEEMDARIAMSLQQEEDAMRASSIRRRAPRAPRVGRSAQFVNASSFVRNNAAQQIHRDFNPHDYEALLALDEDNHQHTGASTSQINSLPESVVKSCNFEEPCAVCLETPSIGETIRHLPCLHKFHKDCIDQWLQRKKECPVCKCSIF